MKFESGLIACDEYHRLTETVDYLKKLGVDIYRFSIAWTRIQPNGTGEANLRGLAFYRDLITKLTEAGIEPMVTIYHWDLPQALEDNGGWTNRKTVEEYVNYAKYCLVNLAPK